MKSNEAGSTVAIKGDPSLPSHFDAKGLAHFAGQGMETANAEDFAIPFLYVLQKMSPQVDEDHEKHIAGAKPGMFLNTVTGQLFDGATGIRLIPVHFEKNYVEWVTRDAGGGFVATSSTRADAQAKKATDRETEIIDTANHYCLAEVRDGEWEPVIVSCTSTKLRASREWMSAMSRVTISDGNNKFVAPTFSKIWRLRTVSQKKDQYTYYNFKAELEDGWVSQEQFDNAVKFRDQVTAGIRGPDYRHEELADAEIVDTPPAF